MGNKKIRMKMLYILIIVIILTSCSKDKLSNSFLLFKENCLKAGGQVTTTIVDGYIGDSVSMTCYEG